MSDDFKFTYSDDKLNHYFGESVIFPYVNHLQLLLEFIDNENKWKKIIPIVARKIRIATLLNELIGFSLLNQDTSKKGLVEELIEVFQKNEGNEIVFDWFSKKIISAKNGHYFGSISRNYSTSKLNPLFDYNSKINSRDSIDKKFIIVEGTICFKETLKVNGQLFDSLKKSKNEWVMCNFPPEGMILENEDYSPDCLLLDFDEKFLDVFGAMIPFIEEIGWYPKCTVGGFFDQKAMTYLNYPVLKTSIIQFQKPKHPDNIVGGLIQYLQKEYKNPIYLKELHSRIYLYYFVLEMFNGWDISYENIDPALKEILSQFYNEDKNSLTSPLQKAIEELNN